jgi:hypothetical protein
MHWIEDVFAAICFVAGFGGFALVVVGMAP